jgi:3-hydroxyisobutyrate dehydrogenase
MPTEPTGHRQSKDQAGMVPNTHRIGWIGIGRMGLPMAERLLKGGNAISVWNRTRAKAEPLQPKGAALVDRPADLAGVDILFTMVATAADLESVLFGKDGVLGADGGKAPAILVDCSSIGGEESAAIRKRLKGRGTELLAAPVSGNGKCVKAGKLSMVISGSRDAFDMAKPYAESIAPAGVAYVGEGELARFCKIAHNVLLGVVIQNLCEITVLAEKAGVSRHAFLSFINNSVLGSTFTRYKSPALVNLDFTTTFTPTLLRKDLDLGLTAARELDVAMPVTAAAREALQAHFGAASLRDDPKAYIAKDFAAVIETVALAAGLKLESENREVPTGLEVAGQ